VVLRYSNGVSVRSHRTLLEHETSTVELEPAGKILWLHPNAGAAGYYRWSMEPGRLRALADRAADVLTTRERIEFLGNLEALLDAGTLGGREYVHSLNRFARDSESPVVQAAISGLATVHETFVTEELEDEFAVFVRRTLRPALKRIGIEKSPDEQEVASLLRSSLFNWLGDWGRDEDVRSHARGLAESYLEDAASVDPSVAGISLGLTALTGDRELFDTFRTRFETADEALLRRRFLSLLGGFRDPDLQNQALAYALTGPLRAEEMFTIPLGISETDAGHDRVVDWILENFDEIAERIPQEDIAVLPIFAGGCSRARFEMVADFLLDPSRIVPGTEARVERVRDQVDDCIQLKEKEGQAVADYLRESVELSES
jgi:alanyl aminopeptidase